MDPRNDNPCDRILPVLGPQNDIVQHKDLAAAIETVPAPRSAQPAVKLAFEFLVLTAARSDEVRLASWTEINTTDHLGRADDGEARAPRPALPADAGDSACRANARRRQSARVPHAEREADIGVDAAQDAPVPPDSRPRRTASARRSWILFGDEHASSRLDTGVEPRPPQHHRTPTLAYPVHPNREPKGNNCWPPSARRREAVGRCRGHIRRVGIASTLAQEPCYFFGDAYSRQAALSACITFIKPFGTPPPTPCRSGRYLQSVKFFAPISMIPLMFGTSPPSPIRRWPATSSACTLPSPSRPDPASRTASADCALGAASCSAVSGRAASLSQSQRHMRPALSLPQQSPSFRGGSDVRGACPTPEAARIPNSATLAATPGLYERSSAD